MKSINQYKIIFMLLLTLGLLLSYAQSVYADDEKASDRVIVETSNTLDIPAIKNSEEDEAIETAYPTMRLTQDRSEMVKLEQDAASIIVGNPNHISVLLDTPNTLVVVPRAAGASHFTVMAKDGSILMQRHVIVGAPKEKYIRIRRSCNSGAQNCQAMSTYFCPDTCHEVQGNSGSGSSRRSRSFF